jgi:hypothetical protein
MYRRKRRILTSLVLGFAVAAFAAPAALGEPRGAGNSPNHPDFWNYDAAGHKIADTSPGLASADLTRMYGGTEAADTSPGFKSADLMRMYGNEAADTSPGLKSADLLRMYGGSETAAGSDDRSLYRGVSPQLDPAFVSSPDDRNVYRGVETPSVTVGSNFSPAIRGEQVKSLDRPSLSPVSQPTVTVSNDDGFQWVDAGFGAASTLALVLLMGAATLMIRHQRRRIAVY